MITRNASLALVMLMLGACTEADDYLRQKFVAHSDFVDPSSVMFRNITYGLKHWETWCGEVNAKNRMGGYVGWKPFSVTVYDDGQVFVSVLQPREAPFDASDELKEGTEELNKTMSSVHARGCSETKPAPKWIPFWK